jgi:esterase/lipase superfamily enzyme
VLVFPTAGGDAEEIERFHLVGSVWPLVESGKVKLYSVDSVAGRSWMEPSLAPRDKCSLQNRYHAFVREEVVPAIRHDCRSPDIELMVAGASLGAYNAVAALCRYPEVFRLALALSGTYDLSRFADGYFDDNLYFASPMHFLPNLGDGEPLECLRRRFALLAYVQGRWEDPEETWRMATVLGQQGVPNRVDAWGPEHDHDWPAWREMLPRYLNEFV